MIIFQSTPTYDEWCEENGIDSGEDENYNAYCEWRANQ
jgi:hypothetical protein